MSHLIARHYQFHTGYILGIRKGINKFVRPVIQHERTKLT